MTKIKILETPRDGMQGIEQFIPTEKKIEYINILLNCGFHTVEVGSFVSPKAIPQLADTAKVLDKLDYSNTNSRIAVLVANNKGGDIAMNFDIVDDIIYPFSVSETFLKRNINQNFAEAEKTIDYLQNICVKNNKTLIPFLSMGLGNPYGDEWNIDILNFWTDKFKSKGINYVPVSDIIGEAEPDKIYEIFTALKNEFPDLEFGLHLHSEVKSASNKIEAAYNAGIRRFDTVLGGLGGCPMTGREMIANLDLRVLLNYCEANNIETGLNMEMVNKAGWYNLI
ncbi:MAG: hydroxymethylglutaryl-CoA lyase [Marinilabiliales bacterium]|nr:MAG: hydroxymethylglutaryl-CoA lyase [Marinilabiliales bacterium]